MLIFRVRSPYVTNTPHVMGEREETLAKNTSYQMRFETLLLYNNENNDYDDASTHRVELNKELDLDI